MIWPIQNNFVPLHQQNEKINKIMTQRGIKIELPQEVIDELVVLGVLTEEED